MLCHQQPCPVLKDKLKSVGSQNHFEEGSDDFLSRTASTTDKISFTNEGWEVLFVSAYMPNHNI